MSWVGRERGNLGAAGQEAGEAGVLCCGLRVEMRVPGGAGLGRYKGPNPDSDGKGAVSSNHMSSGLFSGAIFRQHKGETS